MKSFTFSANFLRGVVFTAFMLLLSESYLVWRNNTENFHQSVWFYLIWIGVFLHSTFSFHVSEQPDASVSFYKQDDQQPPKPPPRWNQ